MNATMTEATLTESQTDVNRHRCKSICWQQRQILHIHVSIHSQKI